MTYNGQLYKKEAMLPKKEAAKPTKGKPRLAYNSNRLSSKWDLQDTARCLLPDTRIGSCNRTVEFHKDWVDVRVHGDRAWFNGTIRCGSVWACPVCSEKISRERGDELQVGQKLAAGMGWGIYLSTFTTKHSHDNPLPLNIWLDLFAEAQRRLKSTRAYRDLMASISHKGDVRSLEVTHGKAGWHPHVHTIVFTAAPLEPAAIRRWRRQLFCLWFKACQRVGLELPAYRGADQSYVGVDIQGGQHAARYITKFANELTGGRFKSGRAKGRSPWQLLQAAHDGDTRAGSLFTDYAQAFKGKRQLFWSKGLRAKLGVGREMTDQEVLDLQPVETKTVATIEVRDWALVCAAKLRGRVLELAVEDPGEIERAVARMRAHADSEGWTDEVMKQKGWLKRIRWDSMRGYWT